MDSILNSSKKAKKLDLLSFIQNGGAKIIKATKGKKDERGSRLIQRKLHLSDTIHKCSLILTLKAFGQMQILFDKFLELFWEIQRCLIHGRLSKVRRSFGS